MREERIKGRQLATFSLPSGDSVSLQKEERRIITEGAELYYFEYPFLGNPRAVYLSSQDTKNSFVVGQFHEQLFYIKDIYKRESSRLTDLCFINLALIIVTGTHALATSGAENKHLKGMFSIATMILGGVMLDTLYERCKRSTFF